MPLGRLADGWIRTRLLSISIFGWSLMTAVAGFANGFGVLALSRLGVGIGEASSQPAGMSLISDLFPRSQRGTVTAAMAIGVALGIGGALWLGGTVADNWDAAYAGGDPPFGIKGWQAAFFVAAAPGILLAVLLARLPEPVRGAADGVKPSPDPRPFRASLDTLLGILPGFAWLEFARRGASAKIWISNTIAAVVVVVLVVYLTHVTNSLRPVNPIALSIGGLQFTGSALQWSITGVDAYIVVCWMQSLSLRDKPAFAVIAKQPAMGILIAIAALQSMINYGVMSWTAVYAIQHFNRPAAEIGLRFGALITVLGVAGPLIAGPFSDWTNKRFRGGRLYVTLGALTISPFLAFGVFNAQTLGGFCAWFVFYSLVLTMWLPPVYAALMDLVLPRMRGMVMSYYILMMTITGMGLGPYAVGMLSDINGSRLGQAILDLYWIGPAIAVLVAVLIWRMPKDEATLIDRARASGEPV